MKTPSKNLVVYRALDANCNRAREGFRVAEDVARFVLNDSALLNRLKKLRHGVTEAEKSLFKSVQIRLASRDVEKDLGKGNKEKREKVRTSPRELLKSNLKRAQEALRSLEEFSKLIKHPASAKFKRFRYECYQIEEKWF
ncbi:MAG TPA: thiamine-phosphate pyrophosphorylase [bacterium]|nr:thiamine-phosphate pyrophosphorylase [bacterium]